MLYIDADLATLILSYLQGCGEKIMSCCLEDLHINSDSLSRLAKEQDRLGFRGFVEGRLSRQFEQRQRRHYWRMDSMRSLTKKWAANLVDHIFRFTHCQWTYWNNFVHYRARDGAETVAEYKARMKQIEMLSFSLSFSLFHFSFSLFPSLSLSFSLFLTLSFSFPLFKKN